MQRKTKTKTGFTLAEVLITLGIIGIVAAMTIPTLVANYQEKSWGTAADVFEKKLNEALKVMNTNHTLAGYTNTEDFVKELSKHIKILNTCTNDKLQDCFSETLYWGAGDATPEEIDVDILKTAKNFGQDGWEETNIVGVQFANGTNALIAYNPITKSDDPTVEVCQQDPYSNRVAVSNCLAILYDTSGFKSPNTKNKDIRSNANVKKVGKSCAFEIGGTCYAITQFKPEPHVWNACQSNGTSTDPEDVAFMKQYGITSCMYSAYGGTNDYWAGAVAKCGGVSNMPSPTQLGELADYLYDTSGIGTSAKTGLTLNTSKLAALGFSSGTSGSFYIWSNSPKSGSTTSAHIRGFHSSRTSWSSYDRYDSSNVAICIAN